MSGESMRRCRYYPNCAIHTGDPRPAGHLSADNQRDIVEDYRHGLELHVIARLHDCAPSTVTHILRKVRESARAYPLPFRAGRMRGSADTSAGA